MLGLRSRLTLRRQHHLFNPQPFSLFELVTGAWRAIGARLHTKEEVVLGPESVGMQHPPRDPHDVEGRKWFRRTLITLCVCGYAMILMPQDLRDRLNGNTERLASPTWGMTKAEKRNIKEICKDIELKGLDLRCHRGVIRRCETRTANGRVSSEAC